MMENKLVYKVERLISYSAMDSSTKYSMYSAAAAAQDGLTENFGMLKIDNFTIREKFNAFWAFTKLKVKFEKRPGWGDCMDSYTLPVNSSGFRTNVNTICKDKKTGQTMFVANIECCALDFEKHRPVRLNSINYPQEGFPESVYPDEFEKFNVEFSEDDFVFEQTIRSQHIDMSHHMNNCEYVRIATGAFSEEFIRNNDPKEFEVHWIGETTEGQKIRVYKKEQEGRQYIKITEGQRTVFEMVITF